MDCSLECELGSSREATVSAGVATAACARSPEAEPRA